MLDDYAERFLRSPACAKLGGHDLAIYHDAVDDPVELARRLQAADALVLTQQRTRLPASVVENAPDLKLISQTGRNLDHLDLDAIRARGITLCAGSPQLPHRATAELAWALILASRRHLVPEAARLRAGEWQASLGEGLWDRTLGIYAYGQIGSLVARFGRAFGMRVVCWGREGSTSRARADGYDVAASREAFFAECDVVSLHVPLKAETRGIVTRADLARMKRDALLVNTSRAGIVEEGALVEALRAGRPGFAAVDVFEREPVLGAKDPLLALPNCLCTPHLGYAERRTLDAIYDVAVEQVLAFAAGSPMNVVG